MSSQTEAITIVAGIREGESESAKPDTAKLPNGALLPDLPSLTKKLAHEPLIHFLLVGAVLFTAGALLSRDKSFTGSGQNSIHVSSAEIQRLSEVWSRQYGRAPNPAQMKNLIDEYIREEILYREALASGLDKDDTIIRRRLVEKMEFLSQEVAAAEPAESELQDFFNRNREKFRIPAQAAFSHIYFSSSRRGTAAESDARNALTTLRSSNASSLRASNLGDNFMLQNEYPAQTEAEVQGLFGQEFASELFRLNPGTWEGPIRSSYGLHLARISQYTPSRLPEFAEVRTQVVTDFKNQRLQNTSEAYYARLRARYRVDVDNAALAAVKLQPAPAVDNSLKNAEAREPADAD